MKFMTTGTKSVLFGVHAFWIHPFTVAIAWTKLYGFPVDPRLWFCFFFHDIGYIGCEYIDKGKGKLHPLLGAKIISFLFGSSWGEFVKYHSRGLARLDNHPVSPLCYADKLSWTIEPWWLYLPRAILSGELTEYMESAKGQFDFSNKREWYKKLQEYGLSVVEDMRSGGNGLWCSSD